MRKAVHFGAGNIGRGFIGALLSQAGYEVIFVDINEQTIDALNERSFYRVFLASPDEESFEVNHVRGLHSGKEPGKVVEAIEDAELITTAVGPHVLPVVAKTLAEGLKARLAKSKKPLEVIACENLIGASKKLQAETAHHLDDKTMEAMNSIVTFPNAAVDRIVPVQTHEDVLAVSVEPFFEWVVEKSGPAQQQIDGVLYVDELQPYIERKLYTVNTGHAVAAYVGVQKGETTVKGAMDNKEVYEITKGALQESGSWLVEAYGFSKASHDEYIEKILGRFQNPYISDELSRVGRAPIRKLGLNERLVGPARKSVENGKAVPHLARAIAAALYYENPLDEEAVQLQKMVEETDHLQTLSTISTLAEDHPLLLSVKEYL
ncbi:mannitol-1-phosphate 5-dehydrogenase [Bacillus fonticola]|uniref:mannitol-1-phosphate 5-dehydrogenase n=1 Tax=Bacillus fonticola TaxID=2728853 RepID=UPI001475E107|nr:mannitol-1-phosphate 5-dehydrogenase [Bacillus fonticola]